MLDTDLAALYEVDVKVLNQAVRRNRRRFPLDFMFRLTGRKYPPYAFTEQDVAMLSGVLRSPRAVRVNIQIMRTFVRLRQMLESNAHLRGSSTSWKGGTTRSSRSYSERSGSSWRRRPCRGGGSDFDRSPSAACAATHRLRWLCIECHLDQWSLVERILAAGVSI